MTTLRQLDALLLQATEAYHDAIDACQFEAADKAWAELDELLDERIAHKQDP